MFTKLFLTARYALKVHGYNAIPSSSFPAQMGCTTSDMFRISISDNEYPGGISLAEFHTAFLCCPVFQIELFILSKILNTVDPITTQKEHLMQVALGEKSSFGPWTAWAVNGNRTKRIVSTSNTINNNENNDKTTKNSITTSACQIMRCRVNDKPFCDTWWAVEKHNNNQHPELVFGSAILNTGSNGQSTLQSSWILKLLMPLHNIYSRLLLGSAKATLVYEAQKRTR